MPRTVTRTAPAARLSDAPLPPWDPASPRWPGRDVVVAGVRIHVRSTPTAVEDAEPALCVHGLGGSSGDWIDLAGQLSGRLAVEALDLPGFGRSGPAADGKYSIRSQARSVIDYLEHSRRGPVHLIGNSMGGLISLFVAAQRPDLVRTLTLISPAVPDVRRLRAHALRNNPYLATVVLPGLGDLVLTQTAKRIPVEQRVRATVALCFADPSRLSPERARQAAEDEQARDGVPWANAALVRSTRALARVQFLQLRRTWKLIGTVSVPTLVLWGDTDRLVAADLAPFVAEAMAGSRLLVLDRVGHTAMLEDPVSTARAVLALVEDAAQPAEALTP